MAEITQKSPNCSPKKRLIFLDSLINCCYIPQVTDEEGDSLMPDKAILYLQMELCENTLRDRDGQRS